MASAAAPSRTAAEAAESTRVAALVQGFSPDPVKIEALEDSLARFPAHPSVPRWLWQLGGLWDRTLPQHACAAMEPVPALALKYPQYFVEDCCGCESWYTHQHWRDLVHRFPADPRAADAAYLLTAPAEGGECERSMECSIANGYVPLEEFLRRYPSSPLAPEAVRRANKAFLEPVSSAYDPRYMVPWLDPARGVALVARYDTTATGLAPSLRLDAYRVIGPFWAALGNAARAAEIHQTLLGALTAPSDSVALRQAWDGLVAMVRASTDSTRH